MSFQKQYCYSRFTRRSFQKHSNIAGATVLKTLTAMRHRALEIVDRRAVALAALRADAPRARHTRPIETNQAAASSPWPRRAARHPWFRADPSMSAETTANLPYGTATAPLTPCHGPAAGHARGAPSQLPAPRRASQGMPTTRAPASPRRRQAARAGGRAMRLPPTPTAQSTCGDTFGGPGARPLSSRAGAAGTTACRRGLDGPHATVRAPISLGNVANEGPGARHRWPADDDACPSTSAPHQALS